MKAESVSGGDGTLALAGRERGGADPGPGPERDADRAVEGAPSPAAPEDTDSAAQGTEPQADDTSAVTARKQADADAPDTGREPARTRTASRDSAEGEPADATAAQESLAPGGPEEGDEDAAAAQESTGPGADDGLAPAVPEPADDDAPVGRKPAGAKTAPDGDEREPAEVTAPSAEARGTDLAEPQDADADTAAEAELDGEAADREETAPERPTPGGEEPRRVPDAAAPDPSAGGAPAGGGARAEKASRTAQDDAPGREPAAGADTPGGPGPASPDGPAERATATAKPSRPAQDDAPGREPAAGADTPGGPGPASPDGPAERATAAAKPSRTAQDDAPGREPAAGADTPGEPGPADADGPAERATAAAKASRTAQDGDPRVTADGADEDPAAPVRRPAWARRDERPDGTAPAPRPSWAKDDDERPGPDTDAEADDRQPKGEGESRDRRTGEGDEPPERRKDTAAGRAADTHAGPAPARPHDPERTSGFAASTARPSAPVLEPTRETPRPALDLLAELTNTPPPPETPSRTLTRRVKVWTPIVLLLGAAVAGGQMLRPLPAPQLVAAQDSVTLDGTLSLPWPAKGQGAVRFPGSGEIATFGEQKPMPTASMGKVMTAYVILKDHPLRKGEAGPLVEVDAKAVADGHAQDESTVSTLTVGQKLGELDLLKMLMLPSANNVARLLARWDGGEEAFVAKMNAAARDLGMRDTTYTDPSGLQSSTVSTAVDQLKLAEAVMRDEAFRSIVELPSAKIQGLPEAIKNSNTLVTADGHVKGIKTGSSTPAGGTLMWAAEKQVGDETPLILGTLMDQHAPPPDVNAYDSLQLVLKNSGKLVEAVRKALASTPVIHKGQTVGYVSDGLGGRTPLVAAKDLSVIGVPGQKLRLTLGTAAGKSVPHEAREGAEVALLTVGDGLGAKTVPVAVGKRLAEPSFGTRVTRIS
ncbi:serine hydrolase [Streptomyces sp. NPDC006670]|uniref:D-alanyl-D-alanine carboxypeptidase n=1 Tax=Streptomyces sp. NPDC006670 TaxID=3154476 RepID=UPI0033CBE8C9